MEGSIDRNFPVKSDLGPMHISTLILVILMISVSVIGLTVPAFVYQTDEMSVAFVPNDILNLILGVPLIIISMLLTGKNRVIGLLCYPGALFYVTYVYSTYLLGLPFNALFLPYIVLIVLSIYTMAGVISGIDHGQIRQMLAGRVPVRSSGIILLILASLIIIYQVYQIVNALVMNRDIGQLTVAQWIVDLLVASPPVLIIAIKMLKRKAMGYSLGISLLLFLGALFIGLVPIMVIKGIITETPSGAVDVLIVAVSSLICLIPFYLYSAGIIRASGHINDQKS